MIFHFFHIHLFCPYRNFKHCSWWCPTIRSHI